MISVVSRTFFLCMQNRQNIADKKVECSHFLLFRAHVKVMYNFIQFGAICANSLFTYSSISKENKTMRSQATMGHLIPTLV